MSILTFFSLAVICAGFVAGGWFCGGAKAQPAQEMECYSTAETREKIAAQGLSEPFRSMQKAAARFEAQALAAKLCRRDDNFVYEISLLRRDGRIVRSQFDAKTGKIIESKSANQHER
jgi:uncharacterized membrane protein YkoI